MNKEIYFTAEFIRDDFGVDYTDRYMCPDKIHNYLFRSGEERYVWQSRQPIQIELTEGNTYSIKAVAGRRLFGGRGLSISNVEIINNQWKTDEQNAV
jgi:hypothetical protein